MPSETRAPSTSRDQRSRPKLSVPSQCWKLGPANRLRISICSTSWVAMAGAKIAHSTIAIDISAPSISEGFRNQRALMASPQAYAWVDRRISEIDDEIHDREDQREAERDALNE